MLFMIGFFLIHPVSLCAQTDAMRLHLDIGVRQNYVSEPNHVLQPTLHIDKKLGVIDTAQVVVRGGLYWGYWQDGINEVIDCPHCYTYSHRGHVLGSRLIVHGVKQTIPIQLIAGLSREFINNIYIGGSSYSGDVGADLRDGFWQLDTGAMIQVKLTPLMRIKGGIEVQIPLWEGQDSIHQTNTVYSVGFGYLLGGERHN